MFEFFAFSSKLPDMSNISGKLKDSTAVKKVTSSGARPDNY